MGNAALIRPATRKDLPAIQRIYNDAIRDTAATWDEAPWTMEQRVTWWDEHAADASSPVLAAEVDGCFAGFAYLSWYRRKSGYRYTREDTIYLDPRFHGQGIGRDLLAAVIVRAREIGLHALVAIIEASNAASIALHRSAGFEVVGCEREVGFKFGRWLDLVTMELLLEGE